MAMNHSIIMGRLTAVPELRRTNSGKAVVSFTVACDKPGKDNGASFIPCVAWEKTGEFINQYFTKGSAIAVEGRLESRSYDTKDGQKRTVLEVVVSQAHFCGKKEESGNNHFAQEEKTMERNFTPLNDADFGQPF